MAVPEKQERPKAADFTAWSDLIVGQFASGARNEHIRAYLKSNCKETWQLANWLTHSANASLHEAHLVLDATANVLAMLSLVVMKGEAGSPESCPNCKSYRVVSVFEPDLDLDPPYVSVCEACEWNSYDAAEE